MQSEELVVLVRQSMDDLKAVDVRILEVSGLTSITDYMIMSSGTSDRHVRSIANNVIEAARKAGHVPIGIEGQENGEWVLVDLGDVVAHIMQPDTREFYKLENLWEMQEQSGASEA